MWNRPLSPLHRAAVETETLVREVDEAQADVWPPEVTLEPEEEEPVVIHTFVSAPEVDQRRYEADQRRYEADQRRYEADQRRHESDPKDGCNPENRESWTVQNALRRLQHRGAVYPQFRCFPCPLVPNSPSNGGNGRNGCRPTCQSGGRAGQRLVTQGICLS